MRRIVTVYGLVAGAIVSAVLALGVSVMKEHQEPSAIGMIIGFGSMLLAFTFIFVAVKTYRDRHLGGVISFGRAFRTGMWVAIIASVCYTTAWVIIYKNFVPEFGHTMMAHEVESIRKSGKPAAEIAKEVQSATDRWAVYDTWPGLIGFTLLEILPLGLLVALVAAAVFRRAAKKDRVGEGDVVDRV